MSLQIQEIFYSIQGESLLAGKPTVFVRTAGCGMRCVWCDTAYAFGKGETQTLDAILAEVRRHPTRYVCVTGGEPLAQPATLELMARLLAEGYTVSLETGGGIPVRDVPAGVIKIIDVKCPDSRETKNMAWENLDLAAPTDQFKFVVASRADFDWAVQLCRERSLAAKCPLLFSPAYGLVPPADLAAWVLESGLPVTMQLQMHKTIWSAGQRGV